MENKDKKSKIQNFDAEMSTLYGLDTAGAASSTEATGLMYCPPRSENELRSKEQLFNLQVNMPPEGYVGNEREWRADIERFYHDEAKTPLKDTPINYMARHEVLDPLNTFAVPPDSHEV